MVLVKRIKNIYKALVLRIKKKTVLVDAKLKCLYNVQIQDFNEDELSTLLGTSINVYIKNLDPFINKKRYASYKRAKQEYAWNTVMQSFKNKKLISGQIIGSTKGGYLIHLDNGFYAFLPLSQIAEEEVDKYVPNSGNKLMFHIIGVNRLHFNIIVSRKLVIMQDVASLNAESISTINVGSSLFGIVKGISHNGLFVYINENYSGFIAAEEAGHGYNIDLFKEFSTGQRVEAVVLDVIDNKIGLSIRKHQINPMLQFVKGQKVNVVLVKKIFDDTNQSYHVIGYLLENNNIFCRVLKEDKALSDEEIDKVIETKGNILVTVKSINEDSYSLLCTTKKSQKEIWNNFVLHVQEHNNIVNATVVNKSKHMLFLLCMEKEICVPITQVSYIDTMTKFQNIKVNDVFKVNVIYIDRKNKEAIGSIRRLEYEQNVELRDKVQELVKKSVVNATLVYTIDNNYAVFNLEGIIEQSVYYNKVSNIVSSIKSNAEAVVTLQIYSIDEFGNLEIGPVSTERVKSNVKTKKFNISSVLAQFRSKE